LASLTLTLTSVLTDFSSVIVTGVADFLSLMTSPVFASTTFFSS
jgi:hypothetical protein